jgi:hypothetical protein
MSSKEVEQVIQMLRVDGDGTIKSGAKPYIVLFRLANSKGIKMLYHTHVAARAAGVRKQEANRMAAEALRFYVNSGHLIIPPAFLVSSQNEYTHDSEATANRNMWAANRKIYTRRDPDAPLPEYHFNTTSPN